MNPVACFGFFYTSLTLLLHQHLLLQPGRPKTKYHDEVSQWVRQYLDTNPVYDSEFFRRVFGVPRALYDKLMLELDDIMPRGVDATGKSLDCRVRFLAFLRWLAKARSPVDLRDQACISESTMAQDRDYFCRAIIDRYEKQVIARPSEEQLRGIMAGFEKACVCVWRVLT